MKLQELKFKTSRSRYGLCFQHIFLFWTVHLDTPHSKWCLSRDTRTKRLLGNISNSPSMNVQRVWNSHQLTVCSDQKKYQLKNQSRNMYPFSVAIFGFFYYLCIEKSKTNGTNELEINSVNLNLLILRKNWWHHQLKSLTNWTSTVSDFQF